MNKLAAVTVSLAAVTACLAACGGNVVVDGNSSGNGNGGATTQPAVGGSGMGGGTTEPGVGGSAFCFSVPISTLGGCSGSSSGGAGCVLDFCDGNSDVFEASCQGIACSCSLNGVQMCTCALTSGGDICSGAPNCCFPP